MVSLSHSFARLSLKGNVFFGNGRNEGLAKREGNVHDTGSEKWNSLATQRNGGWMRERRECENRIHVQGDDDDATREGTGQGDSRAFGRIAALLNSATIPPDSATSYLGR